MNRSHCVPHNEPHKNAGAIYWMGTKLWLPVQALEDIYSQRLGPRKNALRWDRLTEGSRVDFVEEKCMKFQAHLPPKNITLQLKTY